MAAGITGTDGMFSVREAPWHGLGTVLDGYPAREEAQPLVHGWEPVDEPIYRKVYGIGHDGPTETYEEIENRRLVVRSDSGATLGTISNTLELVTNDEMWDVAEALEGGASGDVMYETGGSLFGGKKVWLLLRLRDPIEIKGDPNGATVPYYALQNSHDGSGAFRGQGTNVRVVCSNTAAMSDVDAQARGTEFTFRHTRNVRDRIDEAKKALQGWREGLANWQLQMAEYLSLGVDADGQQRFIEEFIPMPRHGLVSERVANNVTTARQELWDVLNGPTCEGIDFTAYGLLAAASEWSEHIRAARTPETRFKRAMLTRNDVLATASRLAYEVAV